MSKTQEELNAIKAELEVLNNKVKELNEEELENIAGGMISFDPLKELLQDVTKRQFLEDAVLTPAHITRLTNRKDIIEEFCKKYNIDLEELLEYIENKKAQQQTTKE